MLPPIAAVDGLLHQLAVGLKHIHQVGAHADLRPESLRFRDSNTLVLFDLNGVLPPNRDAVIVESGSHGCMPPEQVRLFAAVFPAILTLQE
jgi:hypothetical protein